MAGKEVKSEGASQKESSEPQKPLSTAQRQYIRRMELEQWKNNAQKLRNRNVVTGLVIGAFVMGVFGYTIYSVSQERILDELDEEARIAIARGPRTGAN
ncbi:cytochrome c oxidase assembly factor 3 homolog, mitochondrial [Megalops cyprinoides]|uniref:cytochrome c oxidase assembly factor 3 homolog, mitochondrial n=1 Tax=Megalops cyprinoides TaxID=118141 RepID=UPI0018651DE9|nr:cytochrome c oxidase assembly factor 3 homolog, mitochondrial [Megalops cyprinoides]